MSWLLPFAARYIPQSSMSSPTLPGKQLNRRPALNPSVPRTYHAPRLSRCVCLCVSHAMRIICPVHRDLTVCQFDIVSLPTSRFPTNRCIVTSWLTLLVLTSQPGCKNRKRPLWSLCWRSGGLNVGAVYAVKRLWPLTSGLQEETRTSGCIICNLVIS